MSDSGIARKVDRLGRVVLPVEIRRSLGIEVGDLINVSVDGQRVVMRKVSSGCTFCDSPDQLREFADRLICEACVTRLTEGRPLT
ncbi:MAG: AbrB/MazE/SpoVT family DNA-binding domain-containing protein [Actinobacteria bacterium]|uniref:Unannotated protein n=1 Tax=freshwater metagenome TaxID=449393 RepID=A0A6J7CP24_9ZZZZ|nr:AbrB/MazE/SpoVT family DNA-binding domain-containing protein [Actinomycetota bacterium]